MMEQPTGYTSLMRAVVLVSLFVGVELFKRRAKARKG